jgi:hypothetical protein
MSEKAAERLPYDAKHVIYRESVHGLIVTAFWTSDPDVAALLADQDTPTDVVDQKLWLRDDVEIVATATRHYRYEGADFSGWIVKSKGCPSDPIPNKRVALKALRAAVAEYFNR